MIPATACVESPSSNDRTIGLNGLYQAVVATPALPTAQLTSLWQCLLIVAIATLPRPQKLTNNSQGYSIDCAGVFVAVRTLPTPKPFYHLTRNHPDTTQSSCRTTLCLPNRPRHNLGCIFRPDSNRIPTGFRPEFQIPRNFRSFSPESIPMTF